MILALASYRAAAGIQTATRPGGSAAEARRWWEESLQVREQLRTAAARQPAGLPAAHALPQDSSLTALAWGEDLVLLGRHSEAGLPLEEAARDPATRPYALLFQAGLRYAQGDQAGADHLLEQVNLPDKAEAWRLLTTAIRQSR